MQSLPEISFLSSSSSSPLLLLHKRTHNLRTFQCCTNRNCNNNVPLTINNERILAGALVCPLSGYFSRRTSGVHHPSIPINSTDTFCKCSLLRTHNDRDAQRAKGHKEEESCYFLDTKSFTLESTFPAFKSQSSSNIIVVHQPAAFASRVTVGQEDRGEYNLVRISIQSDIFIYCQSHFNCHLHTPFVSFGLGRAIL